MGKQRDPWFYSLIWLWSGCGCPSWPTPEASQRQQQLFDLVQTRLRLLLRQTREPARQRDVVVVASEHQLILFHLDRRDGTDAREHFQFGNLQQQLECRRQRTEAVAH